jgi:hypothetical protein
MADLTFASFLQGPLGEAIRTPDDMGQLPVPDFAPAVRLTSSLAPPQTIGGPLTRLLGPGDVAGIAGGSVVRTDPPDGARDVEPNYMAVVEVVPPELPWVLTPAKAANGRLRPWMVLVVLDAATTPLVPGNPLPTVEAPIAELPDLRDSWGWAHVQRTVGGGMLPGGGQASAAAAARLVCPRKLEPGRTYRACLVPSFASGVAAALGDTRAGQVPHDLAWKVDDAGSVKLPVFHTWTFATGPGGDFEELVERLEPADPEALRVSSVRWVDVRAPWPGDTPLAEGAQVVGVQGALVPFADPPAAAEPASAEVLAEIDRRLRAQLDAPARRLAGTLPDDGDGDDAATIGALAPPLYGGRHVVQDLVGGDPAWLAQLSTSVANRVAAGIGAEYVRTNQEDLMARAWQQVGAIREANRLRAVVELTTAVAERVHQRHVAPLEPGEVLALAAPASARTRTSPTTTLAMETRVSRMVDGTSSSAFARRVRPAGKLARRTGVSVRSVIPRALSGEVTVPAGAPVIPDAPTVVADGLTEVSSQAAATQLVLMSALAQVATLNAAGPGGQALSERIGLLGLAGDVTLSLGAGDVSSVAAAIAGQVGDVSATTGQVLVDLRTDQAAFGAVSEFGVAIAGADIAGRVADTLHPGDSHRARLDSRLRLPAHLAALDPTAPVMACPDFPVPTGLALLDVDPDWFMPGLGALPTNKVVLLRQNEAFIESYLVGMNHEMMRELLWREYPTDQRGTPFRRFWPRPDGTPDIPPIHTWLDGSALGTRLLSADSLSVLLVRGDVVRRYPGMVVTAVPAANPDADGNPNTPDEARFRPDPAQPPRPPVFVIRIDEATMAYAFEIPDVELTTPATRDAPGWFFVFAEHGYRIRFGFDEVPDDPNAALDFAGWNDAMWPDGQRQHPGFVPVARGHALAGAPFGPPPGVGPEGPLWNRDAADVARIALQRLYRVAIQAEVLLHPKEPA